METTIRVLEGVELPILELVPILRQGALLRLPYLESRLREARAQVRAFEAKYETTFDVLERQGLPDDASYQMHEDFIEWEYWAETVDRLVQTINNVKKILEKVKEIPDVYPDAGP